MRSDLEAERFGDFANRHAGLAHQPQGAFRRSRAAYSRASRRIPRDTCGSDGTASSWRCGELVQVELAFVVVLDQLSHAQQPHQRLPAPLQGAPAAALQALREFELAVDERRAERIGQRIEVRAGAGRGVRCVPSAPATGAVRVYMGLDAGTGCSRRRGARRNGWPRPTSNRPCPATSTAAGCRCAGGLRAIPGAVSRAGSSGCRGNPGQARPTTASIPTSSRAAATPARHVRIRAADAARRAAHDRNRPARRIARA